MAEVAIPFGGGLDETTRSELVDPNTSLLVVQNVFHTKKGALSKSLGTAALTASTTGSGTNTVGRALFSHRGELAMIDGHYAEVYTPAPSLWSVKGRVPECNVRRYPMPFPGYTNVVTSFPEDGTDAGGPWVTDIAYCNGYIVLAGKTTNGSTDDVVTASIIDATTMMPIRTDNFTVTAYDGVKLCVLGNVVIGVYSGAASTIHARAIDLTSGATLDAGWGTQTTLVSTWSGTSGQWDVDGDTAGTSFALVWGNDSGGPDYLSIRGFVPALTAVSSATNFGSGTTGAGSRVSVCARSGAYNFWVSWDNDTNATYVAGMTVQGVVTYTAAAVMSVGNSSAQGIVSLSATTGRVVAVDGHILETRTFGVSGGAVVGTGSSGIYYNFSLVTRPFSMGGRVYAVVSEQQAYSSGQTPIDKGRYVVDLGGDVGTLRPVGVIGAGLSSVFSGNMHVASLSSTKVAIANCAVRNSVTSGLEVGTLDFGELAQWTTASLGDSTYISCGVPQCLDSRQSQEISFLVRPQKPVVTTSGTGLTIATGCRWIAIYEFVNAAGDVEWSAPSDPSEAITGSNKTYSVKTNPLVLTSKQTSAVGNHVRIAIYRTADNGGTAPYYRVGTIANVISAGTITYDDSLSFANASANAQLYTEPGIIGAALARQAPPAMTHVWQHNDRIMGLADDGVSVFYSGGHIVGEALWFSDAQQFAVEGSGRNIAGWSQDGRNVIAKESELYVIDGDGPPDNGGNGTEFSLPKRIPSDVGCINPRSIVTTVGGTFFQSRRGIELLTRSLQVQWIGESIQDSLAQVPYITGACLDVAGARVIFSGAVSQSSGLAGDGTLLLIYDLTLGLWSYDTHFGVGIDDPVQGICMANVSGIPRFHWLSPAGLAYRENLPTDAAAYLDGSHWRTMDVVTASFKLAGLIGYQQVKKIQLLCSKESDHNLIVQYAVNDSNSWTTARTFTRAEINALDRQHLEIPIGNDQKCRSIRFQFTDATPTGGTVGTGKGTTLYGLAISYDTIQDLTRRQADAR